MHTSDVLSVEVERNVATLWLDNPDRRNAMGPSFWDDLPLVMRDLSETDAIRAVVLSGKGPHFSVGLDLKALPAVASEDRGGSPASRARQSYKEIKRLQASITSVAECSKPVIAAVHGYCIGGGIDLICACDIRLASGDAVFSVRETKLAIVADLGTLQRLPRLVTSGHAAELAFTGRDITAERAARIGLVNDVLPDREATLEAALTMAGEIAENSPLAVQGTKAVMAAGENLSVAGGLDYVATWNAAFLASHDLGEAMTAFMEKRAPSFEGT